MKPHPSRRRLVLAALVGGPVWQAAIAAEPASDKPAYVQLGEFTVNLPQEDGAQSYVLVDITLDAAPAAAQTLRDILPRLKEATLRQLMAMANKGELKPGQTDPMALKAVLLDRISKLQPGSVRDVLITRLLYG